MTPRSTKAWRPVAIGAACITFIVLVQWFAFGSSASSTDTDGFSSANSKTLIVHIFANTDPEYLENLKFFVEWGIPVEDQSDYVIVVQSTDASTVGLTPGAHRQVFSEMPRHCHAVLLFHAQT